MGKQLKFYDLCHVVYSNFTNKIEKITEKKINFKRFCNYVPRQDFSNKLI